MNEPNVTMKLSLVKTGARMVEPIRAQPADHIFEVTSTPGNEPLIVCRADGSVTVRGIDGIAHEVDPVAAVWIRKGVTLYGQAMGVVQGP